MAKREAALQQAAAAGRPAGVGYYTVTAGRWEPAGQWRGRGAGTIGLRGEVDPQMARQIFERRIAPDGSRLGQKPPDFHKMLDAAQERVTERIAADPAMPEAQKARIRTEELGKVRTATAYYDGTFSPAKSVSVYWRRPCRTRRRRATAEMRRRRCGWSRSRRRSSMRSTRPTTPSSASSKSAAMCGLASTPAPAGRT